MGGRLFEDGFAWSQRLEARGLRSRFQWIRTEKRAALSRAEISRPLPAARPKARRGANPEITLWQSLIAGEGIARPKRSKAKI
jgi:hypothetical protein